MRPVRIPYTVAHCGSEDDLHLASELLQPGPGCKGWRSAQYCIFPQELVLQLGARSEVTRLQVMAHNCMIPSSMEVLVGDLASKPAAGGGDEPVDLRKALFASMGTVEWADNRETNFSGRQMQVIDLEGGGGSNRGLFLKLVLRRNHINRENEYNQVSLLGVNVLGHPVSAFDEEERVTKPHREDLAFLMYTDPDIVEIINQLEDRKAKAQDDGREEYARKLRRAVKNLEEGGQELGVQVALKRGAVDRKDFGMAKILKEQIEKERERIYRENNVSDLLELTGQRLQANDERGRSPRGGRLATPPKHKTKPRSPTPKGREPPPPRPFPSPRLRTPSPPLPAPLPVKTRSATPPPRQPSSYDMREIAPRRDSYPSVKPKAKSSSRRRPSLAEQEEMPDLSSGDRKELSAALEVFGGATVGRALHKNPSEKSEACKAVKERLLAYADEEHLRPGKMVRATSQILGRLLRAQVWGAFSKALEVHSELFGTFLRDHRVARKEVESAVSRCYSELMARVGDTNERVADGAEDALQLMLDCEAVRQTGVMQEKLVVPIKSQSSQSREARMNKEKPEPPKQALTRCELMLHLVKNLDLAGVSTGKAAEFAVSAVTHTAAPVRKFGEKLTLCLHSRDPARVRRAVTTAAEGGGGEGATRNRNVALRKLLEEFDRRDAKMNGGGGGSGGER